MLCKCLSNISMVPWAIWATASSVALLKVLTAAVSIAAIIENAKFQNTSFAEKRNFEQKLHKYVTKSYFTQGPLNIWTEHSNCQIPYARHYNPLLIRNRSWILTILKARILRIKALEKTFLDFKKWVKSIQTAGYNGARTVFGFSRCNG